MSCVTMPRTGARSPTQGSASTIKAPDKMQVGPLHDLLSSMQRRPGLDPRSKVSDSTARQFHNKPCISPKYSLEKPLHRRDRPETVCRRQQRHRATPAIGEVCMVEHRSYLIGARSKLVSFHSAAGCNDDNAMIAVRPLPAASETSEIWQLTQTVAIPARSHRHATRDAELDPAAPGLRRPTTGIVSSVGFGICRRIAISMAASSVQKVMLGRGRPLHGGYGRCSFLIANGYEVARTGNEGVNSRVTGPSGQP